VPRIGTSRPIDQGGRLWPNPAKAVCAIFAYPAQIETDHSHLETDQYPHTHREQGACGPQWVYEIKHDGYRLIVRRQGARVKLYTRRGYDWSDRFPWITEAVGRLRIQSAVFDGEAVICGKDGVSDFNKLHARGHDHCVFLYTFDLLELNGDDLRSEPLETRKARLHRLLSRADNGIQFNEHVEDDGELVFRHACKLGLEGIIAKRVDMPYRSARCKSWIKVKNPASPAMLRIEDGSW
jgi:bifunctional non-homologous end joining protein LigD